MQASCFWVQTYIFDRKRPSPAEIFIVVFLLFGEKKQTASLAEHHARSLMMSIQYVYVAI